MKSIREIILNKGEDYVNWEIDPSHLVGMYRDLPFVVRAILERTAVIHPIGNDAPEFRRLCNLSKIKVWPQDIIWRKRNIPHFELTHG